MSHETIGLAATFLLFFVAQLFFLLRSQGSMQAELEALDTRTKNIEHALEIARAEYVTRLECASTHRANEKYMGALVGKLEIQIAALAAQIADLKIIVNEALNK